MGRARARTGKLGERYGGAREHLVTLCERVCVWIQGKEEGCGQSFSKIESHPAAR